MTIKPFIKLGGILLLGVACSRVSPEEEAPQTLSPLPQEAPVPVSIGTGLPAVAETKAAVDNWNGQELYIFGFVNQEGTLQLAEPFINNVKALSPSTGNQGAIGLYDPSVTQANTPFYYAEGKTYDFFGYHHGGAATLDNDGKPAVSLVENEGYRVELTLDGQQDVMVGTTDRIAAAQNAGIPVNQVYSAFAARRDVHPELVFEHVLSRFRFRLLSGSEEAAQKVNVDALRMQSDSQAGLLVAGYGVNGSLLEPSTPAWMDLGLSQAQVLPAFEADPVELPGSIMVIPGESQYALQLHLNQEGVQDGEANTVNLEIDFSRLPSPASSQALPGRQYWVNIVVYSLEAIRVTVSLTEWEEGENFEIDPDEDFYVQAAISGGETLTSEGGDIAVSIQSASEYTYTLGASWIHAVTGNGAPATKAEMTEETLHFTLDPNPGTRRSSYIQFYVGTKRDYCLTITQEGASDIPDGYGIYRPQGQDYIFDPASQLISVYAQASQRWTRFLFPASQTVYELGPLPASLSQEQVFTTTYREIAGGNVGTSRNVTLSVVSVDGRHVKLLDTNDWTGYNIIY